MIASVNGIFLEEEKAFLNVSDLAIQRGYAAFDYLRTKNHVPLFLDDYINRFFHSAEQMHLQTNISKGELKEMIHELNKKNNLSQSGIRMILTGGYSPDSYEPATANLVILQQPLSLPGEKKFMAGLKVITSEYQRDLPAVKSTNYLMGIWLQQKIREKQAADVLYHSNGLVSEFPRANVFVVQKDQTIVTPSEGVLRGITRMKLLELVKNKFKIEERKLHLDEVRKASEIFMTSTTKRIMPVVGIDDQLIGDGFAGAVTTELNKMFVKMEDTFVNRELAQI